MVLPLCRRYANAGKLASVVKKKQVSDLAVQTGMLVYMYTCIYVYMCTCMCTYTREIRVRVPSTQGSYANGKSLNHAQGLSAAEVHKGSPRIFLESKPSVINSDGLEYGELDCSQGSCSTSETCFTINCLNGATFVSSLCRRW